MPRRHGLGSERGAVLIHVAIGLLGLLAFSALAVDYGVFWVSRRQIQNAADGAALAGALSLALVAPDDVARAKTAASLTGVANQVWGAPPVIDANADVSVGACPAGALGLPDTCVRANAYRNQARGNALPTFFARLVGVDSQGVRATATAQVMTGNAVDCLKPWAVPDRWDENWENGKASNDPWTPSSYFDKYKKQGNKYLPDPTVTVPDAYVAPTANDPGTGFTPFDSAGNPTADYGLELTLKIGSNENRLSSGWFLALDLPRQDGRSPGAEAYRYNIKGCSGAMYQIGDTLTVSTKQGDMVGPTRQGLEGGGGTDADPGDGQPLLGLIENDPGAHWDAATRTVLGSCAPGVCADGRYYSRSPRIVPVPLFDLDTYFQGAPTGKATVTITNIAGFFVDRLDGNKNILGRMVALGGTRRGGSRVDEAASFIRTVALVR